MESSTKPVNGHDDDESFTMLCAAIDIQHEAAADKVDFLLSKLAKVRENYHALCFKLADDCDSQGVAHDEETVRNKSAFEAQAEELKNEIASQHEVIEVKDAQNGKLEQINALLLNGLADLRNRK